MADDPDAARRDPAGVLPVQLGRRRPGLRAGRQDQQPRADREHPSPTGRRPAVLRATRHFHQAGGDRQLRRVVEHQRVDLAHPRHAARAFADGDDTAVDPRHADRDRACARRRLRARVADRPPGDDRLHGGAVGVDPRLHHRVPVRVRLQARLVSRAGLGEQFLRQPRSLRVAADPDRAFFLDPRDRPRSDPGGRAFRLPGDQGDHRLRRRGDDGVQPARRPDVQGRRSARPAQVTKGRAMATDMATLAAVAPAPRKIAHTVSPSLWTLAWRRLLQDRVAMVSMAIVAAFLVMIALSASGLIAADWSREVGVNYAPPTFMGPDASSAAPEAVAAKASTGETLASTYHSTIVDPLAGVLAQIRGEAKPAAPPAKAGEAAPDASVDPLADVMAHGLPDERTGASGDQLGRARVPG